MNASHISWFMGASTFRDYGASTFRVLWPWVNFMIYGREYFSWFMGRVLFVIYGRSAFRDFGASTFRDLWARVHFVINVREWSLKALKIAIIERATINH